MNYWDNQEECIERRIDSDLTYCGQAIYQPEDRNGFNLEEIAYVLAKIMGENDGSDWHWVIAMKDHTYAYVTGGCDYTGWGCQDWGEAHIYPTMREAVAEVPEDKRKIIVGQLTGEIAFGADS